MALRYEGWEVRTAADGSSAVRTAREFRPDAVVLDVMLPDFDGFEVLRRMRGESPDVPVLFLTAKDSVEDRVAGLTAGGDDYVTKPFSLEELVARLRGLLRRAGMTAARQDSALVVGDLVLDEDSHEVRRGDDLRRADRHRVRAAALPHAQPEAGAVQGPDPGPGVELRLRRAVQRRRALHLLPAQEDRRGPGSHDPYRARRGLRAQTAVRNEQAAREDARPGALAACAPGRDRPGAARGDAVGHRGGDDAGPAPVPLRPPGPRGGRGEQPLRRGPDRPVRAAGRVPYGPPAQDFLGPVQGPRTVGATIQQRRRATRRGEQPGRESSVLPDVDDAALLDGAGRRGPHHRGPVDIGDYRMVATETAGTVYVIGQPAGGAQDVLARLVVVEVIAIGVALLGGGFAGAVLVRRELRPLERVADTAAKVSALPLDRGEVELAERVPRRRPAHRGRAGRERVEPDAGQRRGRAGGTPGQRDAVASVHRRRQPRAAHPARGDPRLRGADPPGPAPARDRVLDRPDLVADRADDDAGRRPAAARAAGCGTAAGTRRRRPDAAGARRGQRRLRRRDGPPLAARPARRAGRRPRRRAAVDPGADQPARERPHAHACGHDGDRRPRPRRRRGAAHRDRRRPGDRPGPAAARVRAVRPRDPSGARGTPAARGWASRSSTPSWPPTAAR